jgi:hypothetical protein
MIYTKRFEIDDPYLFIFIQCNPYYNKVRLMTTDELTKLKEEGIYCRVETIEMHNKVVGHITKIANLADSIREIITIKSRECLLNYTSSENGRAYLLNDIEEESFNKVLQILGVNK